MRQATKLVLAVILSAVSTVSLLSVVGAFLIVVSHSLHYTGPNWSQSREFQALAQPLRLATAAPPSPGPSLIMHELDAEIQKVAFNVVPGVAHRIIWCFAALQSHHRGTQLQYGGNVPTDYASVSSAAGRGRH